MKQSGMKQSGMKKSGVDQAGLERTMGYVFKRPELLSLALTHRSVSGKKNNERLEFLGDSIVNMVMAEVLFEHFPQAKEGQLSRLRASLVSGAHLASVATTLDLGRFLNLGAGELKSGGFRRESILADAMEAIIGAIYLDGGMTPCCDCLSRWMASSLKELSLDAPKDSKTVLQEYLQSIKASLPRYEVVSIQGEAHDQWFEVLCHVECVDEPGIGEGASRRQAEKEAASQVLEVLGVTAERCE